MSQLNQIQVVFNPEEDRLLLRVSTRDRAEFRFWLTRRLVMMLWPELVKTLENDPEVALHQERAVKQAIMAFQQEKALSSSDFETPYQEGADNFPLGNEPMLVTRVQIRPGPNRTRVLLLNSPKGQGVQFAINEPTLYSLLTLLKDTVAKTGWGLDLEIVRQEMASDLVSTQVN